MTPRLSPPVSRILALAILAAFLILAFTGIVQPLLDTYYHALHSADELRSAIEHAQMNDHGLAQLEADVKQLRAREQSTPGFLRSTSDALAAAELQDRLKGVITGVHADLRSTQILPVVSEANARRITLRSDVTADIAQVQKTFYELEAGSPMLFLDHVQINPRPTRGPQGVTIKSSLEVHFEVYGYMRSPS